MFRHTDMDMKSGVNGQLILLLYLWNLDTQSWCWNNIAAQKRKIKYEKVEVLKQSSELFIVDREGIKSNMRKKLSRMFL